MGLNSTPSAERLRISFFGCRNAGKSSLVNAVTGQSISVVSDVCGTTTDPVSKAMELLPLGPVIITDTPGFDDVGELGEKRVLKTKQILNKTDIAVLVTDALRGESNFDFQLIALFKEKGIPYLHIVNKSDFAKDLPRDKDRLYVSAKTGENIEALKRAIAGIVPVQERKPIVSDLIKKGGTAVLVTPIDSSAPKGRLILPQQQTVRDILDSGSTAFVTRETELEKTLSLLKALPDIVITDSQVFEYTASVVPESVPLTSFSILMARYKGFLSTALSGVKAIDGLSDGDTVLIAEGCTHHRQCGDIGTVKIPRWLREYTGKNIKFKTCSGTEFPEELSEFSVIIHCGGCMLSGREVGYRMKCANDFGVPFTNYGTVIARIKGILDRSVAPLGIKI